MTPTRLRTLAVLAAVAGLLGWVLAETAYGSLIDLPWTTGVTAALIGVFLLGLSRVIAGKVSGRSAGKPMHPLQVARAAVLAKASSAGGSLVLGFYAGLLVWTSTHRTLQAARDDSVVAGVTVAASVLLVAGGLLLERACRTPPPPD